MEPLVSTIKKRLYNIEFIAIVDNQLVKIDQNSQQTVISMLFLLLSHSLGVAIE